MTARSRHRLPLPPTILAAALALIGAGLGGCAGLGDTMGSAFADPAKYDLYECKQLEPERKYLAARATELQGLMTKADTGVAGPLVAELAYRNELIAVRAQAKNADEAWRRNKCRDPAGASAAPVAPITPSANVGGGPAPERSGNAVY